MSETESRDDRQACSSCRLCERTGDAPVLTISRLPQPAAARGRTGNEGLAR